VKRRPAWSKNSQFERESPFREDWSTEADVQPLLEAVTRKRLVKTLQAGKNLTCVTMTGKMWKSAMAL
jgi:hypothetical protein